MCYIRGNHKRGLLAAVCIGMILATAGCGGSVQGGSYAEGAELSNEIEDFWENYQGEVSLVDYLWDKEGEEGFLHLVLTDVEAQTSDATRYIQALSLDIEGNIKEIEIINTTCKITYNIAEKGETPYLVNIGYNGRVIGTCELNEDKGLPMMRLDTSKVDHLEKMIMTPVSLSIRIDVEFTEIEEPIEVTANMKDGEKLLCAVIYNDYKSVSYQAKDEQEVSIINGSSMEGKELRFLLKQVLDFSRIGSVTVNDIEVPIMTEEASFLERPELSDEEVKNLSMQEAMEYFDVKRLSKEFRVDPEELTENIQEQWGENYFSPYADIKVYEAAEWEELMTMKYGDEWKNW